MKTEDRINIQFLGGAGTVTGSKYLINTGNHKILIDCGLFQGLKNLRELNWEKLPINESEIDCILLTHGHMDHTGYLPKLVKEGFKGTIFGTPPTLGIAEIILLDSAKIQEEDAKRANEEKFTRHSPALPLYTIEDAEKTLEQFKGVNEGEWIQLYPEVEVRFQYNGHIIGATFIELNINGKRLVFSGDIGRESDILLSPPKKPEFADYVIIESTYGDQLHLNEDVVEKLKDIVLHTIDKKGTLIIPSFAVERAQTLMYLLWKLRENNDIPGIPMIMDSPMAKEVIKVFTQHRDWHKLSIEECTEMCNAFKIVEEFKETWEVIDDKRPKIVIAGSGMITGGRVLSYLKMYIDKPETTVLLTGYQAEGTRGRALLEGEAELKFFGKYYPVKAEVFDLKVLSAHADQSELIDWMGAIKNTPQKVFLVHGEPHAADALRVKIKDTYGWEVGIPQLFDKVLI